MNFSLCMDESKEENRIRRWLVHYLPNEKAKGKRGKVAIIEFYQQLTFSFAGETQIWRS